MQLSVALGPLFADLHKCNIQRSKYLSITDGSQFKCWHELIQRPSLSQWHLSDGTKMSLLRGNVSDAECRVEVKLAIF